MTADEAIAEIKKRLADLLGGPHLAETDSTLFYLDSVLVHELESALKSLREENERLLELASRQHRECQACGCFIALWTKEEVEEAKRNAEKFAYMLGDRKMEQP